MKVQIGYEHFNASGERDVRVTPIDQLVGVKPEVEALLGVLVLAVDSRDMQPGDGEIDVKIDDKISSAIKQALPLLGNLIPAGGNLFFRIRPAS